MILDRFLNRQRPERKSVTGGAWLTSLQSGVSLSVYGVDWQARAAMYLRAYKTGWFYKAGSRISRDFGNLAWTLAFEDAEGDNEEEIVAPANNVPWRDLDPLEQFLRLSETHRALKQQCQIHLDFTGRALIWMENGDGGGLPTALMPINPSRMWESRNANNELIGWVLDKDRPGGGVPFTTQEVLVIEYPGAENDPVGVVEAIYAQVPLTDLMARHIGDVMTTGGRLAGMAWPKTRTLDEREFQDAQRAWRNVASDPNAARRLLLFPEPMEYEAGAATPKDLVIPELATLSRDEILTAFPISPESLMVPTAAGLNSGETRRYIRRDYWEGTIHPRAEIWEDAFQQQLIPRYEAAVGRPLDFDIEEPNMDDAPAIIEKIGALKGLIAVGFEPKEAVAYVGLDGIKWNGIPTPATPAQPTEPTQAGDGLTSTVRDTTNTDESVTQQEVIAKAQKITRDDVTAREFPGLQAAITEFLAEQRERLIARIEETLPPSKAARMTKAGDDWWDEALEAELLREKLRTVYLSIGRSALQVVTDNTGRIISGKTVDRVLDDLLTSSGVRITDINETTRRTIADTLAEGVRRGYSIPQLTRGVAEEGYGGVQGALMANGVNVWDDLRAETIARTETMASFNEAALRGYREVNVRQVQAIDGDKDAECADRNGQVYAVDDALNISDHPNGTLDWVPLSG